MTIDEKLDKVIDKLSSIEVVQAQQHVTLQEHTRRSTLLEDEVKPIKRHVAMVEGAMKLVAACSMLAVIFEYIHMVFK